MHTPGIRSSFSGKYLTASMVLLFLVYPALYAGKSSAPAKAPAPAKSSTHAAKSASGGGAGTSHTSGPTTSSHSSGPTTASPHGSANTTTGRPASTPTRPAATGRGTPVANGHTTVPTRNGGSATRRADGRVATLRDPKRGMEVHHTLSGNRRVETERGDHSRVVAEHGGRGYVQRPYSYRGHEYARRSYYSHGRYYHGYYGRYYYHGLWMNPYYASLYYGPAFYGWAYNPWLAPVPYAWGWGGNPWYGYYGAYFTPSPVYSSASLWLTDYMIGNSLASAYQTQANAKAAAPGNPAPLTPYVKGLIADEVKQQIAVENTEAKAAGQNGEPDAASSSVQRALTDGKPHVFLAGHDLDVVDSGGAECALSEGDALQLTGQTAPDAQSATLVVLAGKGGQECRKGATVAVGLADLQDMQNHMRESIDQGMQELQQKQGQGGLPAAPAAAKAAPVESPVVASAPPPPPEREVVSQITAQSQEADKAENEAAGTASGEGPNAGLPSAEPVSIELGQTIDQVTAALGTPVRIVDMAAKKIYVYKDMKITFNDGKVTDVQ